MGINVRIRDGMCPDPTTGDGGATEGDIRGSFSDIIDTIGVVDLANGHCLVTENSPAGLSVLVAPGIVYVSNADYDELDSNEPKFYEAIINAEGEVAITANTSGSTRIDLICVKVDKTITPDEHASNITTLVAVAGTPGAGAPTLPDNHAKLAEIEVADSAATIVTADITDSRVQSNIKSEFGGGGSTSSNSLTINEVPTGDIDGSNTSFTISSTPVADTLSVYINGIKQSPTHYSLTGTTLTLSTAPLTGTELLVDYLVPGAVSNNADTVDNFNANATPTANTIPVLDSSAKLPMTAIPQLTSPKINEDVALTSTSTELNKLHTAPTWTEVSSFTNSWVNLGGNFSTCAYLKDGFGFVHLKGIVKDGTIPNSIFTLPTGYRPAKDSNYSVPSNLAFGVCQVKSDGTVLPAAGDNAWFSLDGITFLAA